MCGRSTCASIWFEFADLNAFPPEAGGFYHIYWAPVWGFHLHRQSGSVYSFPVFMQSGHMHVASSRDVDGVAPSKTVSAVSVAPHACMCSENPPAGIKLHAPPTSSLARLCSSLGAVV